MDALGFVRPLPRLWSDIAAGHVTAAAAGSSDVVLAGETWQDQPIAGPLGQIGSDQDVLLVRQGRQWTVLEGGGFQAAR